MASLEEAYSLEYGDIIDPELAYDLFWAGVINGKSALFARQNFAMQKSHASTSTKKSKICINHLISEVTIILRTVTLH